MTMLSIEDVSVSVEDKEVVRDVALSLTQGEMGVLMGPNGSGKSTLVNALMGHPHYTVTKGSVRLEGDDVTALPVCEKAKRGLFLSLQHTPKIGGTTLAAFLHKAHTTMTGETTDVLEYYLALRETVKGYGIRDDLLDRPLSEGLSGGEKKLADMVQLIALRPKVAILDEIDSGVDVDAMKTVFRTIDRLQQEGTTFLLISHHPALLDHLAPSSVHLMAAGCLVRSAGRELAEEIHRDGFCKAIECPLEPQCVSKE
jgi:Fe-S cluster assembly ATP-binding protein